ncbi:hypothetical protein GBM03_19830, partial [Yersinia pseudotuberculosis]
NPDRQLLPVALDQARDNLMSVAEKSVRQAINVTQGSEVTFSRLSVMATALLADKQSASDRYSAVTFLANQGVSVRLNGRYAIQHSKFALIDGETVQTGSLNYTHSAFTRNAENVVVIRGERAVSQAYQ